MSFNKIKFIILNYGHVDSSHPYSWIFEHQDGFDTRFEAAQSLALEYFHVYKEKYPIQKVAECCIETSKTNDNFCKVCGNAKFKALDLDPFAEPYIDWLWQNCKEDHDGCEVSEYFSDYSTWRYNYYAPFGISKENSLYIGSAEKILTGLLYKTGLEDYFDEDILSEILSNTTFEKFKTSFDDEDGPSVYGH